MQKNIILTGGFDGTGGAGIIADSKIASLLKINPYFLTTSIAVQNQSRGYQNFPISIDALDLSLKSIFDESEIEFIKLGMLGTEEIANFFISFFKNKNVKIILDTPLKTSSGSFLQSVKTVHILAEKSFLITPNKEEFEMLGGHNFFKNLNTNFLIKSFKEGVDKLFLKSGEEFEFTKPALKLKGNIRGTGCSFASAICIFLFLGEDLKTSITKAKDLIYKGMENAIYAKSGNYLNFVNC